MYIAGLDAKHLMRKPITLGLSRTVLDARNLMLSTM